MFACARRSCATRGRISREDTKDLRRRHGCEPANGRGRGRGARVGEQLCCRRPVTSTAPSVPTPPPINWTKCADKNLRSLNARCGFLTVPLDYSNPGGAKIQLAVSRVPHTVAANKYQGVMLVN